MNHSVAVILSAEASGIEMTVYWQTNSELPQIDLAKERIPECVVAMTRHI